MGWINVSPLSPVPQVIQWSATMGWIKISPDSVKDLFAFKKPDAAIEAGEPGFIIPCPAGEFQSALGGGMGDHGQAILYTCKAEVRARARTLCR